MSATPPLPGDTPPGHIRERLMAAAAFAGTFLLIPLWDLYALIALMRAGKQARLQLVVRLCLLVGAYLLAVRALPCVAAGTTGQPSLAVISTHALPTLALLAVLVAFTGLLSLLLLVLAAGIRQLGKAGWLGEGLLWSCVGLLAAPTGSVALLVVMLALRYAAPGLYDAGGARVLLAAGAGALLPALITARAGLRAWDASAGAPGNRWLHTALEMAIAFNSQAGWLLSSLMVVEAATGIRGLGWSLVEAFARGDGAAGVSIMRAAVPVLLIAQGRAVLADTMQYILAPPAEKRVDQQSAGIVAAARVRLGVAGLLLALLVTLTAIGLAGSGGPDVQADPTMVYTAPSVEHPFGTDQAGRDILQRAAQVQIPTWGGALVGGMVALAFGGLWGGAAALAAHVLRQRPVLAKLAGGLVRLPAEALLLMSPALVVLALMLPHYAGSKAGAVIAHGVAAGLVLTPRMARAVDSLLPDRSSRQHWLAAAINGLLIASFAAMVYSTAAAMLFASTGSDAAGTLLAPYTEIIAGAQIAPGAGYLRLAAALAAPGIVSALSLYLLQDSAADLLGTPTGRGVARVLG